MSLRLKLSAALALVAGGIAAARARTVLDPRELPAQDMTPGGFELPTWEEAAGVSADSMPAQNAAREAANRSAFLAMIRGAEGTTGAGGYGALFGWPKAGRSFDPYTVADHPRQFFDYTDKAGRKLRTSAAGAHQITYTTWRDNRVAFLAWAALNGYSTAGFLPATQDAFALYLLWRDGALEHVNAGRLAAAVNIARRRWASLPGAGADQPERSFAYVANLYRTAGGTIA